jgi:hypothetical protein
VLRLWMNDEAAGRGKQWNTHCTSKPDQQLATQIIEQFRPLVAKLFVRFTTNSDFLGNRPVHVPPNLYSDIICDHGDYWNQRVTRLADEEKARFDRREKRRKDEYAKNHRGSLVGYVPLQKNNINTYYRSRLCASFPALMDLQDNEGKPLRLTEREWEDHTSKRKEGVENWAEGTSSDPYFANLAKIAGSSGKLREIQKKLDYWKDIIDAERKPARQIWISYFFAGAYIQYLV